MQDKSQHEKSKNELLELVQSQEEELELLRAALELSEVGFTLSDHNGIVLRVNPSQIRITGHDPEQTVGRSMLDIQTENFNQSATMKVVETKEPTIIDHKFLKQLHLKKHCLPPLPHLRYHLYLLQPAQLK